MGGACGGVDGQKEIISTQYRNRNRGYQIIFAVYSWKLQSSLREDGSEEKTHVKNGWLASVLAVCWLDFCQALLWCNRPRSLAERIPFRK